MLPSAGLWPKTKVMISQAIHVLVSNIKQHVFAGIVNQYAALVHGGSGRLSAKYALNWNPT